MVVRRDDHLATGVVGESFSGAVFAVALGVTHAPYSFCTLKLSPCFFCLFGTLYTAMEWLAAPRQRNPLKSIFFMEVHQPLERMEKSQQVQMGYLPYRSHGPAENNRRAFRGSDRVLRVAAGQGDPIQRVTFQTIADPRPD